jgi:hypothetical protein
MFGLRSARVYALARRLHALGLVERALARVRFGSDRFVVQAAAGDERGRRVAVTATGRGECRATGIVAAEVALRLHEGAAAPGVRHLDGIVDPAAFLEGLDGGPFRLEAGG